MFETTNLLPIRYLQDKDNAKVFLEALLGKSISGIERFYWRTNLPEAFDLRQGKPDIYLEDQNKNQYAILERRYGFDCGYQDTVSRFIQNAMSADSLSYHGTVSECSESYIIFYHTSVALGRAMPFVTCQMFLREGTQIIGVINFLSTLIILFLTPIHRSSRF